jgi:hypothetical protein
MKVRVPEKVKLMVELWLMKLHQWPNSQTMNLLLLLLAQPMILVLIPLLTSNYHFFKKKKTLSSIIYKKNKIKVFFIILKVKSCLFGGLPWRRRRAKCDRIISSCTRKCTGSIIKSVAIRFRTRALKYL